MMIRFGFVLGALVWAAVTTQAEAIEVKVSSDPFTLLGALVKPHGGLLIKDVILHAAPEASGTYTNLSGIFDSPPGIILSTGRAADYKDGPNSSSSNGASFYLQTTADQEFLLDQITGGFYNHNDVAEFEIVFDAGPNSTQIHFDVAFGSEEYPEYVGSPFIDGFGLFLNGTNFAFVGGKPVNINHPKMQVAAGTQLDGMLGGSATAGRPFVHTFTSSVVPNSKDNRLIFIVGDTTDSILDTTVYISGLSD